MKTSESFSTYVLNTLSQNPLESLPISEYSRAYLQKTLDMLPYFEMFYESMLRCVQQQTPNLPLNTLHCVDLGGGNGLLSCFLLFKQVARVTYIDIYDGAALDAQVLADVLQLKAHEYRVGDHTVIPKQAQAILSVDVIEHIYNLEEYVRYTALHHAQACQVHCTGANPYNPVINRRLMKVQQENEYVGRKAVYGHKPRDTQQPYREVRRQLIQEKWGAKLSHEELNLLVDATRGQNKADLLGSTQKYLQTGVVPTRLKHPTNTCDPLTGNWSEHLFTQKELNAVLEPYALKATYLTLPYYLANKKGIKKGILQLLNALARKVPRVAKIIQPMLMICISSKKA